MVRQRSSEVRELGRYWRFKETAKGCRRFWQRYWRPRRRGKPLGKYGVGGGNPQESGAKGSRRTPGGCVVSSGGLGEWSVF